jgi:hypothetical protein
MAKAPDPITSPPNVPGQPYDATAEGSVAGWDDAIEGGPCDMSGHATSDFESGPGVWKQT